MCASDRRDTVLVAGATGRLGILVEVLLARGHAVRAMTRETSSPAAQRLRELGAAVVFGDFEDADSVAAAARGADAMFATGTAHKAGPQGEERHGRSVADTAAASGVHLVYSSGDGAAADSPLPLFKAKFAVEEHIRSLAVAHTILAPVYFMENLFNPWNVPTLRSGGLPSPIAVDRPLQQVAIRDLAAFAVLVIERRGELDGRRIPVASDELTAEQAAANLARLTGRPHDAAQLARAELPTGLRALFSWLENTGHVVDIAALHERHAQVGWHDYAAWLRSQRSRLSRVTAGRPAQTRA